MTDPQIFLVGYFQELFELAKACGRNVIGYTDIEKKPQAKALRYLGNDQSIESLAEKIGAAACVIAPDSPKKRRALHSIYECHGIKFASLISRGSHVSNSSELGCGVLIQWGCHVSSNTRISDHCRLNIGCNIMHDTEIDEFCTIAPNACLLGNVKIGKLSYIGANATILPGVTIGSECMIGAGSVVTRDVESGSVIAGNPARTIH